LTQEKLLGWKELPLGGTILKPGNSESRYTGDWRTFKPVILQDKCTRCLRCWIVCPEPAIYVIDEPYTTKSGRQFKFSVEVNYDYCKGCGMCVEEWEPKAIDWIEEEK